MRWANKIWGVEFYYYGFCDIIIQALAAKKRNGIGLIGITSYVVMTSYLRRIEILGKWRNNHNGLERLKGISCFFLVIGLETLLSKNLRAYREDWVSPCKHMIKTTENDYLQNEQLIDIRTEKLIISVNGEDSDSDFGIDFEDSD
ncbi:hypothetical protein FQA39_LY18900 [Lamprigera yunnana]|nr:hypothetical protein FQA39_LY18900 [Lamprigera yunnana]